MTTILYNPSTPAAYPRTVADFRAAFPGLAVGDTPTDAELQPYGWRVVAPTDPPTPGPDQRVEQAPQPELMNGAYRQAWVLVNVPPPPPEPDWLGFAGWLYQFPEIAEAMAAARASSNPQGEPATTGLPAAMQEARQAQNYPAWAATWGQFLLASKMPPSALAQIVAKASECHLPADFIAALQPQSPA